MGWIKYTISPRLKIVCFPNSYAGVQLWGQSKVTMSSGATWPHKRAHPRFKVHVPVEIHVGDAVPARAATADICLGGCYIESMFPYPVGTALDLKLSVEGEVLVAATVVTCDPQFGNGIRFDNMLPEDKQELEKYLQTLEAANT